MPSRYPSELRRQVVDLARSGTRVAQLAETFAISEATIYSWTKQEKIDRGELAGQSTEQTLELAAASEGMDAQAVRRARRLVRKGETAPDCASARLAVALARQRQRSSSSVGLLVFALIPGAAAWLAAERLKAHQIDGVGIFFGTAAFWGLWSISRGWHSSAAPARPSLPICASS